MSHSRESLGSPDLLVVGLGTTGIAALGAARAAGVEPVGIDRNKRPSDGGIETGHYGARVWGIFGDGTVVLAGDTEHKRLKPKAIIVASGSIDLPLPLPGWHLDGVTGAHTGARSLPDGTAVVVLRGPHAGLGSRTPKVSHLNLIEYHDLADGMSVTISGDDRVEAVVIGNESVPVRHVLLDNGIQPENTLARMVGSPTVFSAIAGGDTILPGSVIAADSTLLTVVGDACGIHHDRDATIHAAEETGRILAESVISGRIPISVLKNREGWQPGGMPTLPSQLTDDTLVCPDEGITVAMVRDAIARGATTVNDVKRRTRAAMAVCQGRDCLWTIRAMLAEAGRDWETPMTARPPVSGINLSELAAIAAE